MSFPTACATLPERSRACGSSHHSGHGENILTNIDRGGERGPLPQGVAAISQLLAAVNQQEDTAIKAVLARELTNYVYLRGTYGPPGNGAFTSKDMDMILRRFESAIREIQRLQLGPEAYRPNGGESRARAAGLDGLERELMNTRPGAPPRDE
jgi:hypothetical protein